MHRSPWHGLRLLCKILEGKQSAFIYVLKENGQWKDRQISLLYTVTMATMGTEESGHYNEVAAVERLNKSQRMDFLSGGDL